MRSIAHGSDARHGGLVEEVFEIAGRLVQVQYGRESDLVGHGELLTLGITVAPSTVWEILREAGMDPAPDRAAATWADFLRSQAEALLAADLIETVTLTGTRMYVLAVSTTPAAVCTSWAPPPTRPRRGWHRPRGI